ncbi:helix-turn-helix transcriptional regulator [Pararoseomonas indoligenes]|uniref:AlpA family phage regulatory protein n=1 Tax=Roseomonas indoligenes TaxID=2820811 RepID=A0A940N0L6_9PROT|nr:AlpA family phage regulatory protein [Pararoseomonas indoligenes]MBP0492127.1 AlpA family phage regulatory protein [Pararoseomonas indoligenes]
MSDPWLKLREVEREVGLSRSAIYRRIAAATFPAPRQLGGGVVRWPSSVIAAWKADRPAEDGSTPPAAPVAEEEPPHRRRGRPRRHPAA